MFAGGGTTSPSASATGTSGSGSGGGVVSGLISGSRNAAADGFSPLIITAIAPAPIPVKGSDNRFHVAYELSVFNDAPRPATITKLETLAGNEKGAVVSTLSHDQVVALSLLTADYPASPAPVSEVPAGRTLLVVLDDVYASAGAVPASVTHRITATFGPLATGQAGIANQYPDQVVQIGGPVSTSKLRPVVMGSPVTGDGWLASNGLARPSLNAHRNVLLPLGGRINGGERFAVDWIRVDPSSHPLEDFKGDPSKNESYLAFDQPLLAVGAGTVTSVVSDKPDIAPGAFPEGISLDQLIGNNVLLDLGHGVFALYAHMKQGSATVKVGDKVKKGQEIGRLGNSGNTDAPHLHFQLMRGPLPLSDDNVPWEIDHFILVGSATESGVTRVPTAGPRTDELPLGNTVSNFPRSRH
jgi:hypothetical protein